MRQICRIMEENDLDYSNIKHIRDVIINRYMSTKKGTRDKYPFAPGYIPENWGIQVAASYTVSPTITILIELNVCK